jgi:cytochrome c-type biogenesis protein CcmH
MYGRAAAIFAALRPIEGWHQLLRAYMVLNERDKAHSAALDARRALAAEPGKLRRIEGTIKSLGLES